MLQKYEKTMNRIWGVTTNISNIFLFLLLMLVVVNIIARRFFNAPIFGVTELVCYGSLAAASFGLAQNEWMDGNVRMTLILERTSAKFGCFLNLIVNIVALLGFTFVSYHLVMQVGTKLSNGQLSSELNFPMYIVTRVLAIGFILLTLAILAKLILYILRIKNKLYTIEPPCSDPKAEEGET